jgi:hypothetical protein
MNYSVYTSNGKIVRLLDCNNIEQQLSDDEFFIDGWFNDSEYYIENGQALQIPLKPNDYSVFDYALKQWVQNENIAIIDVSQKRQRLLYSTDWTQLPDVLSEKKQAWAEYRQALRDITSQEGYPFNVIWPTKP